MERNLQQLEDMLRQSLNKSKIRPSSSVLQKLRFRLWINDFFSLNPRKVNIMYPVILAMGIAFFILIHPDKEVREKNNLAHHNTESRAVIDNTKPEAAKRDQPDNMDMPVQAGEKPLLSAGYSIEMASGCAPFTLKFRNTSVFAKLYKWDFGTGDQSTEKNPEYTFSKPGTYNVILNATSENGNVATYKKQITVLESPSAEFNIDLEKSDVATREIRFINQSSGAAGYKWNFGDRHESEVAQPVHIYKDYGSFRVQLIVENQVGCTDTSYLINKFIEQDYTLAFPLNFRPSPFNRGDNGFYEKARSDASIYYPKNNGVLEYKLKIMAPNGMEVFSTTNIKQGWNGYIGGRIAPKGIYSYSVSGVYPNGQPFANGGRVEILVDDYY
jgi:hypothetical protein